MDGSRQGAKMILPGIIPLNNYLALEDCPMCHKGKLMYLVNKFGRICTMCNKKISSTESLLIKDPPINVKHQNLDARQQAINDWMK